MNQLKLQPSVIAGQELQRVLNADYNGRDSQWAEDVHGVLGQMTEAIQKEVQAAVKSLEAMGAINPDFQNAPGTERHIQMMRAQLINLGESVHLLRADIRKAREQGVYDSAGLRLRGQEVCAAIDKMRHTENEFFQTTLNTNPGAGE